MKLPRNLKGSYLAEILSRLWDYQIIHQQGSHIILETQIPKHQRRGMERSRYLWFGKS